MSNVTILPTFWSNFFKQGKEVVKSMGIVFGDIGTSPLYTLYSIFPLFLPKTTPENIFGVISLIIWTLIILVTVEYSWLAMSIGKKGEGGTIVLKEVLTTLLKSPKQIAFVTILSFVGISLFFGDGVITPAVTILSAVEGILKIPGCEQLGHYVMMLLACIITIFLFTFQRSGTERVSIAFGPIMLLWFLSLAAFGIQSILQAPSILFAVNPYYAIKFILANKLTAFLVLSGVILCATGGEALYADMGHLGKTPIKRAWNFVFIVLVLNYLGQGAFALVHPEKGIGLHSMMLHNTPLFVYIPFLILGVIAAFIASQALISGMFSVAYQAITTNIMPVLKIDYTSSRLRSQVYLGAVNWGLMTAVLFMIMLFKKSDNLTHAYGFAVTGTMTITGIMMTWIFILQKEKIKSLASIFVTIIAFTFFLSNLNKIPDGGYWSIIIAAAPLALILIYTSGQKKLWKSAKRMPLEKFVEIYKQRYNTINKVEGCALFFARNIKAIHPYIIQTMFNNNIIYEDNVLISVITRDDPFGVIGFFKENPAPGLRVFEIHMGYMEIINIEKILENAGIDAKVIFYGHEEISTKNPIWKVYSFIKRISPSFVQFFKLPIDKIHGVITSVEI
jgi:KUP system potassium uptake protein